MENSDKRPSRPKARQSIAHIPSSSRVNGNDKQNATIDLSSARHGKDAAKQLVNKRNRGKSIGPGGLEALTETDGNSMKIAPLNQPRSILKPAIPLTPPKHIPTFDELRQRSTKKKSPTKNSTEALLIDFSTPAPARDNVSRSTDAIVSNLFDPFSPAKPTHSVLENSASKENQMDEEERQRQEQKKIIMEQRAARRKSMANRRVSFAPEATLHTWSVMEMVEDSTTSSASNSTRRQSSMTAQQPPQRSTQSPADDETTFKFESIPASEIDNLQVKASPARSRDLQQKQSRRSSVMSEDTDASGDDVYSSSPSGDVATDSSPIRVEDSVDSDSDTDGDTAMSMDEAIQNTIASQGSGSSTQSSLEERLRQAATQAGTKGIEYDEYGDDMSMELANDTVTNAFQPWEQEQQQRSSENQENIKPFSPARKAEQLQDFADSYDDQDTQDLTMEMTRAVGGIVENGSSGQTGRRKSVPSRRRSSIGRRRSIAADSSYGDESMDLTSVMGGIMVQDQYRADNTNDMAEAPSDEDITMEFTAAVGDIKSKRRESIQSAANGDNETMDVTAAVGGILPAIEELTESQTDAEVEKTMTLAMELTRAVGQIVSGESDEVNDKVESYQKSVNSPTEHTAQTNNSSNLSGNVIEGTPQQFTSVASETGSPSLARKTRSSSRTRSARISHVSTPVSVPNGTPQKVSSIKNQATPTKQLTPIPTKSKTPERTPLSNHVTPRGASPKRLFQAELRAKASPASGRRYSEKQQDPLFAQDELTGRQTPRVVLHAPKPHQHLRRRSSGIGIDKEGYGSPSVTQLLARRSSIGDAAPVFKLEPSQPTKLRFEDPKHIADEIDAERAEDKRRESGRFVMEQEANEQQEENATLQLKDMIESMSPKKSNNSKLKGRKSLAVGSARGLLGKRPMELDENEEDADSTPKRLKVVSREGSPVKKIHLPKPPTKEETTGRLTRSERTELDRLVPRVETPVSGRSPSKLNTTGSPQQLTRYKDATPQNNGQRLTSFEEKLDNVIGAIDPSIEHPPVSKIVAEEDKISLQQFLNMTNIHFIELNTTKRRQTLANQTANDISGSGEGQADTTKACFVAAATTMPLLELYQHATRELKSYISTGRKIIRSIESETLAEQPALFREYVEARPDIKLVMDNQFRNGKTYARLQSKEGWYTWRSQLVEGLQSGLQSIHTDMEKDLVIVEEQAEALSAAADRLVTHHEALVDDLAALRQRTSDIDSVDYQVLKSSRQELWTADTELKEKLVMLQVLKQQMHDKEETLLQAADLKEEMRAQIAEADRVREEQRGWAAKDVLALKARVKCKEEQSGWSLISAEEDPEANDDFGVALTLRYRGELRLFFYPLAFEPSHDSRGRSGCTSHSLSSTTAPISLTYLPEREEGAPVQELDTEQRFFLQLSQSQLHTFSVMPKGSVAARTILDTTSSIWGIGRQVSEEIRLLGFAGLTRVNIQGDENLGVKLMLLLGNKSRVDIDFTLLATVLDDGTISVSTSATAVPIYGLASDILNASRARKVQVALNKELESERLGAGAWINAIRGFEQWYRQQEQSMKSTVEKPKMEVTRTEESVPVGSTTPRSPVPAPSRTPAGKRSPLTTKKSSIIQKKIPVPTSRQDKFRTSQRDPPVQLERTQPDIHEFSKDKENMDPFVSRDLIKPPAITPEMQEAMMQRTPIKRIGALRRSPI